MTAVDTAGLMTPSDARLEALEIHVAHQAQAIEDLHATITAQWTAIDALRRQLTAAIDQLEAVETRVSPPPSQRPPHY